MTLNLNRSHTKGRGSLLLVAFLSWLQVTINAFPLMPAAGPGPLRSSDSPDSQASRHLHRWRGERINLQCDVRIAGFDLGDVRVVWALRLRRLSDSGCNPRDPVLTLAEMRHVSSDVETDQIYSTINGMKGWTFHAEGARLNEDRTNAQSAWIGLTIDSARPEDSGTYRCDALVGEVGSSLPVRSMSSLTTVTVSGPDEAYPEFKHVTLEDSVTALDYDSSVVGPEQNHRRVGRSANVTCAPRLLRQAPTLPFSVSRVFIRFLPFRQPGSQFVTVAQYFADNDTFVARAPGRRKRWRFSHVGVKPEEGRNMDSLRVRIHIRIPAVTLEDTGIFDCAVTKATTGNTYHAEAGLKVSDNPNLQSGYCDPPKPEEEEDMFHAGSRTDEEESEEMTVGDLGLEAAAIEQGNIAAQAGSGAPPDQVNGDGACLAAVIMMLLSLLLLIFLARKQIYKTCCCVKDPPPKKKRAKKQTPKPAPPAPPAEMPVEKPAKKPKKKSKKKPKPQPQDVLFHLDGQISQGDDDWSPFTSYHFDYFNDWLYEEPCIPLTNTNIQTPHQVENANPLPQSSKPASQPPKEPQNPPNPPPKPPKEPQNPPNPPPKAPKEPQNPPNPPPQPGNPTNQPAPSQPANPTNQPPTQAANPTNQPPTQAANPPNA